MVKLIVCLVIVALSVAFTNAAECPSFTKVQNCTPRCFHDTECSRVGGKCCPNICNTNSCAQPNVLKNNIGSGSNKDKYSGATGVYCGNVKCNSFEKCGMDKATKRPKCVRS
ncbi:uncharacterized protein LOC129940724 [Eupeodes corollae]|uniref:uncharacterized protein LOC129940724 n=1 Tax=Eupeodes corollae TaxID=290404 RepID=UPI00248FABDC|nr:uncharacterized protein LOC129940724 [Eupeodes corollae]